MAEVPGTFDAGKDARFPASGAAHGRLRARMVLFLCGMLLPGVALAEEAALPVSLAAQEKLALRSQERRTWALNLGILAGVTAYGFSTWSWGESGFKTSSEGWFGRGTEHGGADKLGHAYTGAVVAAATGSLYRHWGYESQRAAELSALSSLLLTGAVEIGDGFSQDYGFSWEDQVSNVAGIGLEYLRQRYPALGERVQFRWEYLPSPPYGTAGTPISPPTTQAPATSWPFLCALGRARTRRSAGSNCRSATAPVASGRRTSPTSTGARATLSSASASISRE